MTPFPAHILNDLRNVDILVAEDDAIFMMLTTKMLEKTRARVRKAFNGVEVLYLLESHSADIILLDLEMPEMDGYTAIKKIREKHPAIPVLALTAHIIDKKTRRELLEKGFTDTIPKPFDAELLYSKIVKALEKIA